MKQIDFSTGSTRKNVAAATFPLLVAQILSLLYSIVDRIYIGRIPDEGTYGLGGIGLSFPIIMIITAFTNLLGMGGAPLCAIARGRRDTQEASRILHTSFTLLILCSFFLFGFFELFAAPALRLFGASEDMLPHALPYLQIYLLGTPATMLASGLNPFINAQGYASAGMLTIFIGAVCNIILDPILIFVFHLGIRGAAIATVVSQFLSMGFVLLFLHRPQCELKVRFLPPHALDPSLVLRIISVGLTGFIMQFTNSLVSIVCNKMLSVYGGDLYISIYTIISSIRHILDVPVGAIADGASPILSFNYGARCVDRMKETVRLFTTWLVLYTLIIWILILLFPGLFIRIFTSDPVLLSSGAPALRIYYFAFVFQAFQYAGQSVFKSLGRTRKAVFFSLLRKVIIVVPLTLWLPTLQALRVNGVFLAEPISNVIGGSACFITMLLTEYRLWNRQLH